MIQVSNLKNIREKFGISQQQVAHWLGISRSLAQHFEGGIRRLPVHALVKLSKLQLMVSAFETAYGTVEQTIAQESLKASPNKRNEQQVPLHPKLAREMDKTDQLHRQLAIYKSKHAVLQQQQMLIQHIMDQTATEAGEKEKLWLQMLYHGVCHKISKFDEGKQLPLKAKILEMKLLEVIKYRTRNKE